MRVSHLLWEAHNLARSVEACVRMLPEGGPAVEAALEVSRVACLEKIRKAIESLDKEFTK